MRLTNKLVPLLLAFLFALPIIVINPSPARAACYWGGSQTITKSRWPTVDIKYTSRVTYQIGYNCSGNPVEILVADFRNTLTIYDSAPHAYHEDDEAAILKWINSDWTLATAKLWGYNDDCDGICTFVRDPSPNPNTVIPYDTRAAVYNRYLGCDWIGGGWCRMAYQFLRGNMYLQYWSP